jgi:CMP-N-acetylneuraminic acid synthetase
MIVQTVNTKGILMFNGKNILAIIPARGGSKRLQENVLELAGKPLIAWTIEAGENIYIKRT